MSENKKVTGVILAAGDSSRFGQNKLLFDWHGIPLIKHVAIQAIGSMLHPVIIVTGFESAEIRREIVGLDLTCVENPNWMKGQSESIKTALTFIANDSDGVCFLPGDQPFISREVINKLINTFQTTTKSIIVPYINSIRANPVIFARETFSRLATITGDAGGRQLFDCFSMEKVQLQDRNLLIDIDSMDDYREALSK